MNRAITLILSIVMLVCAGVHLHVGGLLVQIESRVIYSKELVSSGGDSYFVVLLGLSVFIVSFLSGLLGKGMFLSSVLAMLFFDFMLLLANFDVSLIDSIFLGDQTLLVAFVFAHVLGLYHLTKKLKSDVPETHRPAS